VLDRTVDVHIAHVRKKLGDMGNRIVNRQGHGYCFVTA
jgi:DNA-binding response OmpR family regulator